MKRRTALSGLRLAPLALALGLGLTLSAQAQDVVKIGFTGPLSGGQAAYGADNRDGLLLAVKELNARGVQVGGRKVSFEVVVQDDAADPRQGVAVAQLLADAHVRYVVGPYNSGVAIPAGRVYNDAGMLMLTVASNPKVTQLGYPRLFRVGVNDAQVGVSMAVHAATKMKARTVAVIDDRTAYGQGLADALVDNLKRLGVTPVGREFTNDKATDFSAILTRLKAAKPDAIFYGGMDAQGAPLLRQMKQLGIDAKYLGGDGVCTTEMIKLAGPAINADVFCTQAGIPMDKMPAGKSFNERFLKRFSTPVQLYAPYSYDAASALIEAMKLADSADPARYLPLLQKVSFKGVTGNVAFDASGDIREGGVALYQHQSGKWLFRP